MPVEPRVRRSAHGGGAGIMLAQIPTSDEEAVCTEIAERHADRVEFAAGEDVFDQRFNPPLRRVFLMSPLLRLVMA
jgi:hypothetical protein